MSKYYLEQAKGCGTVAVAISKVPWHQRGAMLWDMRRGGAGLPEYEQRRHRVSPISARALVLCRV